MLNFFAVHVAAPLLIGTAVSPVADVFVDANAANCATGTGSAASPVCSIASAVALASPGDTIRIAPGTYVENIVIPFDLDLIGTSGADLTAIDGSFLGSTVTVPVAVSVVIDGLTVFRGRATRGGGVNVSGDLTLRNSVVTQNNAVYGGGLGTELGAIATNVVIENSTITDNRAQDGSYGYVSFGGGIYQSGGSLTISNSTISFNQSDSPGYYVPVFQTYTDVAEGGGIFAVSTDLTITDSTIAGNRAYAYWGTGSGGGIMASESLVRISNSTISGNVAPQVPSVLLTNSTLGSSLSNVTVAENRSGLWCHLCFRSSFSTTDNTVEVQNSLFSGNTEAIAGQLISMGHNLFESGAPGITPGVNGDLAGTTIDPLRTRLGPLEDNGGPTLTHALRMGSPAIDAGDPLLVSPFDQRGVARPALGDPDIGAVESDNSIEAFELCNGVGRLFNGLCANCPCFNNAPGNTIGGCLNSAGRSARIYGTGDLSLSLPPQSGADLSITMTGATSLSFSVLYSGDAVAPGGMANPCFGMQTGVQSLAFDGLRCAITNTRRHGGRPTDANGDVGFTNHGWGGGSSPHIGLGVQAGFVAGQTRYFQAEYREDALLSCMRGLNTSQAIEVKFTP